ncbi:MAG: hypothetical protein FJ297_15395 [Planctomycetes bacterium]|nr:hypothetical protein [Planctomycetota bacterium]
MERTGGGERGEPDWPPSIDAIHAQGRPGVIAVTGGGALAIGELLAVPGASRSIVEAHVPYAAAALRGFLGAAPERACSDATARSMAMAAFDRARRLADSHPTVPSSGSGMPFWGVGCTASLRSVAEKRGPHRIHVAGQTASSTSVLSVPLCTGKRTRAEEERIAADLVIAAVARACGVPWPSPLSQLPENVDVVARERTAPESWRDVVLGRVDAVLGCGGAGLDGPRDGERSNRLLFPGAFHPVHAGHWGIAAWAKRHFGCDVEFEISVENVDKPRLDYVELDTRLGPFPPQTTVWLTRAPTFAQKARCFPGSRFLVGADTIRRIADPKYYANEAGRDAAIDTIRELGCRFVVFGRREGDRFVTLDDLPLPSRLRALCEAVSEEAFRVDLSSTEVRARSASHGTP